MTVRTSHARLDAGTPHLLGTSNFRAHCALSPGTYRSGKRSALHAQGLDGIEPLPDQNASTGGHRDELAGTGAQLEACDQDPRNWNADRCDEGIGRAPIVASFVRAASSAIDDGHDRRVGVSHPRVGIGPFHRGLDPLRNLAGPRTRPQSDRSAMRLRRRPAAHRPRLGGCHLKPHEPCLPSENRIRGSRYIVKARSYAVGLRHLAPSREIGIDTSARCRDDSSRPARQSRRVSTEGI